MSVNAASAVAVVNVADFGRAVEWWKRHFGFELQYSVDEIGWGEIATTVSGLTIGLQLDPESAGKAGGAVVTWNVTGLDALRASLEADGVQFDGPTNEVQGMVKLASFRDADGNAFMFAESL